jgi:sortase A
MPNQGGTTVISAHRDTHFEFLQDVSISDVFEVTDRNNKTASYRVSDIKIIDATKQDITIHSDQDELKLITCYPFDALVARGPLRYVVIAEMI